MRGLVEESFGLNLTVIRFLGMWPPEDHKILYKIFSCLYYVIIVVPMPLLGAIYLLITEDVSVEKFTYTAFVMVQFGCLIFKSVPFINDSESLRSCVYRLDSEIFRLSHNKKQNEIVRDCIAFCRRFSRLFIVSCCLSGSCWCTIPLLEKEYKLQMDLWLPFDPTTGPWAYYPVYIYLAVVAHCGAAFNSSVDVLTAGLACHAAGQITILKDNLQNLNEGLNCDEEDIQERLNFQIYQRITKCIDHHNAIISFVNEYEKTFSPVTFSQLLASVIVICTACFQLMTMEPSSFTFFFAITYSGLMFTQIFLFCVFGTIIYEESTSISTAIYMGHWYDYDMVSKKALLSIMERAQRPLKVAAGKVLDLSLDTFATVLRRSYSLLAVLNSYQKT